MEEERIAGEKPRCETESGMKETEERLEYVTAGYMLHVSFFFLNYHIFVFCCICLSVC